MGKLFRQMLSFSHLQRKGEFFCKVVVVQVSKLSSENIDINEYLARYKTVQKYLSGFYEFPLYFAVKVNFVFSPFLTRKG